MDKLKEKLLKNKEELKRSIENNSAFSTEKLFQIVADTIEFITNDDYLNFIDKMTIINNEAVKTIIAEETELEEVKSIKESINVKAFCINQIRDLDQYKDNNQFVQGQLYILKALLSELKKIGD